MSKTVDKTIESMDDTPDFITLQESNLAKATKYEYVFRVSQFYKFSPISSDEELIDCPTEELQKMLLAYTRHIIKKVNSDELSANTVPKMFRGIKWLLNSNYRENDIKWKPLEALFPKEVKRSGYKAWTTRQIELMIGNTAYTRNKALIHFQASTGARVGVHDHALLMKHLIMMEWNGHGVYAVLLYADADETPEEKDIRDKQDDVQSGDSYWSFLTPEATEWLVRYHDERKRKGEYLSPETSIFEKEESRHAIKSKQISDANCRSIIFNVIKDVPELQRIKKGRRHDIQLNHGFRKRTNTILKLESNVNSNIAEKILGHKNGLDGVYFTPTRQQCFVEFCKGIPELTISDKERQKIKIKELTIEKTQFQRMEGQIHSLQNEKNELSENVRKLVSDMVTEALKGNPENAVKLGKEHEKEMQKNQRNDL